MDSDQSLDNLESRLNAMNLDIGQNSKSYFGFEGSVFYGDPNNFQETCIHGNGLFFITRLQKNMYRIANYLEGTYMPQDPKKIEISLLSKWQQHELQKQYLSLIILDGLNQRSELRFEIRSIF